MKKRQVEYKILKNEQLWEDRITHGEDWAKQTMEEYINKYPNEQWELQVMTEEEILSYEKWSLN